MINVHNRIVFDAEFADDCGRIELISIGLVNERGAEYYAENSQFSGVCSDWVADNVLTKLRGGHVAKTEEQIADDVIVFCGATPEMWAYFADYNWVLLCSLYGGMTELPKGWPTLCLDLQQAWLQCGSIAAMKPTPPRDEHNALVDARWGLKLLQNLSQRF